ncbi:hypothetical protein OAC75_05570 [Pseudomonadales bacterium]|nr:hypothetical protein [Pseudomonadales bacterium]
MDSPIQALAQQILAGQRRALAKGITLVESTKAVHRLDAAALLSNVMSATGGALRIGISGAPGVGKSTFIEALGRYSDQERKVITFTNWYLNQLRATLNFPAEATG